MLEEQSETTKTELFIVVEEDVDPYCGVHPVCIFLNEEDAEEFAIRMNKKFSYTRHYVMEIRLFETLEEAIEHYHLDEEE